MQTARSGILVTGGAGFIGSAVVRSALARRADASVVTLDALTYAGSLANLDALKGAGRHTFVQGDIRDGSLDPRGTVPAGPSPPMPPGGTA